MLYVSPAAPAHTVVLLLVMPGVGFELIVTLYTEVVVAQLVAVIVSVNCNVPVPAAFHVTVMLLVFVPAVIVPPVMLQLYVCPTTLVVLYVTPV